MSNATNHRHGIRCQVQERPLFEDGRLVGCRAVVPNTICAECLARLRDEGYIVKIDDQWGGTTDRRPRVEERAWDRAQVDRPAGQYAIHWSRIRKG